MSFNSDLQREMTHWTKEGLISPETEAILRQRYPVAKKSMTQTLAVLGSLLLGIGVILFFAANWGVMPRVLKVAVVVLSFTLSYSAGYYLRYVTGSYPKVGYAFICLGSILYGSSIWLIAQIFHLPAEAGMGFFLWYVGVIPVAYLFNSTFNLTLALVNLVAWFLAGHYPLGWPYLIFPLLLGGTVLPLAIRKKDWFSFTIAVIASYIWFVPLGVKLAGIEFSFQLGFTGLLLFSIILYLLVQQLKDKSFFAIDFLLGLSLAGLFVGLSPFTFNDFLRGFDGLEVLPGFSYLVAASLLIIIALKLKDKKVSLHDLPLLLLYPCLYSFAPSLYSNQFLLIGNNLVLFVIALLSIYYGYVLKRPLIFNLSMVMFAAAIVMKYFDFFFALMPRSVFFMSGGVLLLLGSFLMEYKRRDLLKSMERGE